MKPLWLALALDGGVSLFHGSAPCQWPPFEEDASGNTGEGLHLMQLGPAVGQRGLGLGGQARPPGLWNQELLPAAAGGWPAAEEFELRRGKPSYLEVPPRVEKNPAELQESALAIQRSIQGSILQENSRLHRENGDFLEAMRRALEEVNSSRAREAALQVEKASLEGQITQLHRQNVQLQRLADASASASTPSLLQHAAAIPLIPKDKTGIFFVTMTFIGLTVLSMCAFQAYCAANPPNRERPASFHDADWAHIHEHMESRNTTGLVQGREEVRILILLFGFVTVGFCALWWMGVMQPFVRQLLLYTYLAMAVLMLLSVILAPASGVLYMILSVLVGIVTRIDDIFSFTLAEARAFKRLAMPTGPPRRPGPKATAKSGARPAPREDAGRGVCVSM